MPGFLGKHKHEILLWMKDFMRLMNLADDAGLPFIKQMSREQRNKFLQEYVDVSEFRMELERRLADEAGCRSK